MSQARRTVVRVTRPSAVSPPGRTGEQAVSMTVWARSLNGPVSSEFALAAPEWEDIAANYPGGVRADLERLMFDPLPPGQIILWQGPTGTGKTWALKTLAREWAPNADFHFVADPAFDFGDFMAVLADLGGRGTRTQVVVLEDAAYAASLGSLATLVEHVDERLLLLVVVTGEQAAFPAAIARPGRCAASLTFPLFSPSEAEVWLSASGSPWPVEEPMTLAELYGASNDQDAPDATAAVLGAIVATSEIGKEIGAVAEQHAPDGGYGDTAWNATTATVFWVPADWSSNDEIAACEAAFMAIDGVEQVDYESEAALPEGDQWEVVYRSSASAAALEEVVQLARLPLDQEV